MIGRTVVNGAKKEEHDITFNIDDGANAGSIFNGSTYFDCKVDIVFNERITNLYRMFYAQSFVYGTVLLNCYSNNYYQCFYSTCSVGEGKTLIVNYTAICTTIDNIMATKTQSGVKKGLLVV